MAQECNMNIKNKTLEEFEKIMSACVNYENYKQDVENLIDLMLKLRLKVLQIVLDVNRAQIKCVADKQLITAVENTLDDIGSISTTSIEPNNEENDAQGDKCL